MVLNDKNLSSEMSVDVQNKEIERLKNAPTGSILFTSSALACDDIIESLISRSHICYQVHVAGFKVEYVKV